MSGWCEGALNEPRGKERQLRAQLPTSPTEAEEVAPLQLLCLSGSWLANLADSTLKEGARSSKR